MKTTNETHRDAGYSLVELLIITTLALFAALFIPRVGNAGNYNTPGLPVYIDGTTNTTVNVAGSALVANAVKASSTNYFNLSTTTGTQTDTNLWPAVCLSTAFGSPARFQAIQDQFNSTAGNVGVFVTRWAGSTDGSHWQTNPCPLTITETANGAGFIQTMTNLDTGGYPFLCLFSRENTNTTTFITNHWVYGTGKQFN